MRKAFLDTNQKFLKFAMETVLGDVEQNQKLDKGERGGYNVDTLELMAYSWLGFYTSALSCFSKTVDICRDNYQKGWDWDAKLLKPMASMSDKAQLQSFVSCALTRTENGFLLCPRRQDQSPTRSILVRWQVSNALKSAPGGELGELRDLQYMTSMYASMIDYLGCIKPTIMLPTSPGHASNVSSAEAEVKAIFSEHGKVLDQVDALKSAHGQWYDTWQKQKRAVGILDREHTVRQTIELLWFSIGHELLDEKWVGHYLKFVTTNPGAFARYPEFIEGTNELKAEMDCAKVGMEEISPLFSFKSESLSDAMKGYCGCMKARRQVRDKFEKAGPVYSNAVGQMDEIVFATITKYLKESATPLLSIKKDADVFACEMVHIQALRCARDLLTTYKGLDLQNAINGIQIQLKEWETMRQMIELSRAVFVEGKLSKNSLSSPELTRLLFCIQALIRILLKRGICAMMRSRYS